MLSMIIVDDRKKTRFREAVIGISAVAVFDHL